jgi:hypothetical protein
MAGAWEQRKAEALLNRINEEERETMSENNKTKRSKSYTYEDFLKHIDENKGLSTYESFVRAMSHSSGGKINKGNIQSKLKIVKSTLSGTGLSLPKLPRAPAESAQTLSRSQSMKVAVTASKLGWTTKSKK